MTGIKTVAKRRFLSLSLSLSTRPKEANTPDQATLQPTQTLMERDKTRQDLPPATYHESLTNLFTLNPNPDLC